MRRTKVINQFAERSSLFLVEGEGIRRPIFQELIEGMSNFGDVIDKKSVDVYQT